MPHPNHALARAFIAALSRGALADDLLAADMTAWTTTSGTATRERYQAGVAMLASLFDGGLAYEIVSLTAEDNRVAIEARSAGKLADGRTFANSYVFILRLVDGRIAEVAEHFNPAPVNEMIRPLIMARMVKK